MSYVSVHQALYFIIHMKDVHSGPVVDGEDGSDNIVWTYPIDYYTRHYIFAGGHGRHI